MPPTFAKLRANTGSSPRVKLNDFGLSNAPGSVTINYTPSDDGITSLIEGSAIHDHDWQKIDVRVIKGDDYCRDNGVETIDLLKVDVEGAENLVLEGFVEMFGNAAVSAVQFEYGMTNIYSKFLLKDFWAFFNSHDFEIGPVMPTGVDFMPYNPRNEDFQGPPNFLAVHKRRDDLIQSLRRTR
jgi:FkbM family methyltransferase